MPKSKIKHQSTRKAGGMDLTDLKSEDFAAIAKAKFGETIRKGAVKKSAK